VKKERNNRPDIVAKDGTVYSRKFVEGEKVVPCDDEYIYVKCIKDKSKNYPRMRIFGSRFHSPNLNCMGPRNIRREGRIFKIRSDSVLLISTIGRGGRSG
jgi:hypothetical protein